MPTLKRTNSEDPDFVQLIKLLDADLKIRDGEVHEFYDQFNAITNIKHCVLAYKGKIPMGCGAIKKFDDQTMEVKRMYVLPEYRGKQIASKILRELEHWAKALKMSKCILETGYHQPEAIALYKKSGYTIIDNYGQYRGIENSICFEKHLD